MSNVGKRVRLVGEYAQMCNCKTGVITDELKNSYHVLLDDGDFCRPFRETHDKAQCELVTDEPAKEVPQSNVGKRVRLIGDYAKGFKCVIGLIVAESNKTYSVLLDDDDAYCNPFKETRYDAECELIEYDPAKEKNTSTAGKRVRFKNGTFFNGEIGTIYSEEKYHVYIKLDNGQKFAIPKPISDNHSFEFIIEEQTTPNMSNRAARPETHTDAIKPDYYNRDSPYEPMKIIQAMGWGSGFRMGNIIKYLLRAGKKDPNTHIQDLKKAREYLTLEIEHLEKEGKQ